MRLVWVTDSHNSIYTEPRRNADLIRAVLRANAIKADAFVHTGDFADQQHMNVRRAVDICRAVEMPFLWCIGNHDVYENPEGTFPDLPQIEHIFGMPSPFYHARKLVLNDETVLVIALDCNFYDDTRSNTHAIGDYTGLNLGVPGGYNRRLTQTQLNWMAATLQASAANSVLILMHYPPIASAVKDIAALASILQADGRAGFGLFGHRHDGTQTVQVGPYTFYRLPAMLESGAWCEVVAVGGSVEELAVHNYSDPGGWTIAPPFIEASAPAQNKLYHVNADLGQSGLTIALAVRDSAGRVTQEVYHGAHDNGDGSYAYVVTLPVDFVGEIVTYDQANPANRSIEVVNMTIARSVAASGPGPSFWLLRDEYTDTLSAGTADGTAATPGPGTRQVYEDGTGTVAVGSGAAQITGDGTWAHATLNHTEPIGRAAGQMHILAFNFPGTTASGVLGPCSSLGSSFSQFNNVSLDLSVATVLKARRTTSGDSVILASTASSTDYKAVTALRATGRFIFLDGKLLWRDNWSNSATLYDGCAAFFANQLNILYTRVPLTKWLPTPLASDGFGSAFGTTDGLGHAEGVTGGTGSGGGSASWTQQSGTWSTSGGSASCSSAGFATVATSSDDLFVDVKVTRSSGSAGIVARYTDSSNYLIAYHDGTNAKVDQVVGGSTTNKISAAATYSAGATLRLIADGVNARLYYNDQQVGTSSSIDAGLTAANCGLYTSASGNTFDDFVVYARGTNGEYSSTLTPLGG